MDFIKELDKLVKSKADDEKFVEQLKDDIHQALSDAGVTDPSEFIKAMKQVDEEGLQSVVGGTSYPGYGQAYIESIYALVPPEWQDEFRGAPIHVHGVGLITGGSYARSAAARPAKTARPTQALFLNARRHRSARCASSCAASGASALPLMSHCWYPNSASATAAPA